MNFTSAGPPTRKRTEQLCLSNPSESLHRIIEALVSFIAPTHLDWASHNNPISISLNFLHLLHLFYWFFKDSIFLIIVDISVLHKGKKISNIFFSLYKSSSVREPSLAQNQRKELIDKMECCRMPNRQQE
jgi:hypothetical protein